MKRLTLFVASVALALLPLASARAAPGGLPLGCGPAGDVAQPTGLAVTKTADPVKADAPAKVAKVGQPVQSQEHEVTFSDHDLMLVLGTAIVVLLLIIIF